MSKLDRILPLGDPRLYEMSAPVRPEEIPELLPAIRDLHDLILEFRAKYNAGRAIAAPQIGLHKRIICWNVTEPVTLINPKLSDLSDEMFELWDDCMCFPNLLVKVRRHRRCTLDFSDEKGRHFRWHLEDDLSELIQHEYDHLDGILATQRAIDDRAFKWRKQPG
ncbi:MAG: peptide deformylase [Bacteroidetes bacterium]|nr:MAG: peptide deformylase [Bacteroidota bacterium]